MAIPKQFPARLLADMASLRGELATSGHGAEMARLQAQARVCATLASEVSLHPYFAEGAFSPFNEDTGEPNPPPSKAMVKAHHQASLSAIADHLSNTASAIRTDTLMEMLRGAFAFAGMPASVFSLDSDVVDHLHRVATAKVSEWSDDDVAGFLRGRRYSGTDAPRGAAIGCYRDDMLEAIRGCRNALLQRHAILGGPEGKLAHARTIEARARLMLGTAEEAAAALHAGFDAERPLRSVLEQWRNVPRLSHDAYEAAKAASGANGFFDATGKPNSTVFVAAGVRVPGVFDCVQTNGSLALTARMHSLVAGVMSAMAGGRTDSV